MPPCRAACLGVRHNVRHVLRAACRAVGQVPGLLAVRPSSRAETLSPAACMSCPSVATQMDSQASARSADKMVMTRASSSGVVATGGVAAEAPSHPPVLDRARSREPGRARAEWRVHLHHTGSYPTRNRLLWACAGQRVERARAVARCVGGSREGTGRPA